MIVTGAGEKDAARHQEEVRREQAVRSEKQQRKQLRTDQGTSMRWGRGSGRNSWIREKKKQKKFVYFKPELKLRGSAPKVRVI